MSGSHTPGMIIQGICFLAPQEALEVLQQGAVLLDLRSDELVEMKAFSVPEIIYLPHITLAEHAADLPKDRLLILADSSGVYTKGAATTLKALGFDKIACLNGGMIAWDQANMPLVTDPDALLHGDCACVMRSKKDRSHS
ncbi:MAG: rhodanese-like domain-containing protein [Holophaga sp.]|nr:rhodanese-like domain-containing protein [Holophaga sp.]